MKLLKSFLLLFLIFLLNNQIKTFDLDLGFELSKESLELHRKTKQGFILDSTNAPSNSDTFTKGYTFIFSIDDVNKVSNTVDKFDVKKDILIIYRADGKTRVQLDMKQMAWFCGKKDFCDYDTFISHLKDSDLNVDSLKSQVATFFTKINGSTKVCKGELYKDKAGNKGLIFCFNGQSDFDSFITLFANVNEKDMDDSSKVAIDIKSIQSYKLNITDGHEALLSKKITFKDDGAYVGDSLMYRYDQIEAIDNKKCKIAKKVPVFWNK